MVNGRYMCSGQSNILCFLTISINLVLATDASAQRTDENVMAEASDAFGTTVGNESIGLYSPSSARGFSPVQAGNIRIEGLYFDQVEPLNAHTVRGSAVRVGISAQAFPFPAPTGIVDYQLRLPSTDFAASAVAAYGPHDSGLVEVDAQASLIPRELNIGLGAGFAANQGYEYAVRDHLWTAGAIAHWRPSETLEVISFFDLNRSEQWVARPLVFIDGTVIPPPFDNRDLSGQDWTVWFVRAFNLGAVTKARFGDHTVLRVGAFHSAQGRPRSHSEYLLNVTSEGGGDYFAVAHPPLESGSTSGEIRLTTETSSARVTQTFHGILRARDRKSEFGGDDTILLGRGRIGANAQINEPAFSPGRPTEDRIRQFTGGIGYDLHWEHFGQINLAVRKTSYRRSLLAKEEPTRTTTRYPWLYSVAAAAFLSSRLAIYGSYTRGLEESGVAPENAINRGEPALARVTRQLDAGVRYHLSPQFQLIAGVFEVRKPYFSVDENLLFTQRGNVRHRGIELSAAGQIARNLRIVAGAVFLQPRLLGDEVVSGQIGRVPVGPIPRTLRINAQYDLPFSSPEISLEAEIENLSGRVGTADNRISVDGATTLDLGVRYSFEVAGNPALLRLQARNLTNTFAWEPHASGRFSSIEPRRFSASLTVDF